MVMPSNLITAFRKNTTIIGMFGGIQHAAYTKIEECRNSSTGLIISFYVHHCHRFPGSRKENLKEI